MADCHKSRPGILLYYKYVNLLGKQHEIQEWFRQLCGQLEQRGRIRVAADGINVTVCIYAPLLFLQIWTDPMQSLVRSVIFVLLVMPQL